MLMWGKVGEHMSDLIDRQAAIEELECVGYDFSESGLSNPELEELCEAIGEVEQDMIMRIRHLPSAQTEIIRCKECKYWFDIDDGRQKHRMCADFFGEWFCADAERRTDERSD